jgi:hypothetical protein
MDEGNKKILIVSASIACIAVLTYVKKYGNTPQNKDIITIVMIVTYVYAIYKIMTDKVVNFSYYGIVITLGILYMYMLTSTTENYGGPIRNTRKIPMTDCYKFCDNNYGMCTHMYPQDNVNKCNAQWRACRAECYFPNVQRMY